jgi:hypothetical protein
MLNVSQVREKLGQTDLTNKQVENLRDALYVMVENILDDYYANTQATCKKQSSIAESHRKNKKAKGMVLIAKSTDAADMQTEKNTR